MHYLGEKIKYDSATFKQLFKHYFPILCLFSEGILKDDDASQDVVQEVFIKLLSLKAKFENEKALRAYLYVLTKNRCIDYLKNSKKAPIPIGDEQVYYSESQFSEDVVKEETFRLLYLAIQTLGPQSQKVIELTLSQLNNQEISDELDISVNTVKTLKLRAYKKLRKLLGSELMSVLLATFF